MLKTAWKNLGLFLGNVIRAVVGIGFIYVVVIAFSLMVG